MGQTCSLGALCAGARPAKMEWAKDENEARARRRALKARSQIPACIVEAAAPGTFKGLSGTCDSTFSLNLRGAQTLRSALLPLLSAWVSALVLSLAQRDLLLLGLLLLCSSVHQPGVDETLDSCPSP